MAYRRVTKEDRIIIKSKLEEGLTKKEIADKLGFNKSTITREVQRNTGQRGYRAKQAHRMAIAREKSKHGPYKMTPVIMMRIIERLDDRFHLKCTTRFHRDAPGNFMEMYHSIS